MMALTADAPSRDAQPVDGVNAALGSAFNTRGVPNDEEGRRTMFVSFEPGLMGVTSDATTGLVKNVNEPAASLGVQAGWYMHEINGQPWSSELLDSTKYQKREVSFQVPQAQSGAAI